MAKRRHASVPVTQPTFTTPLPFGDNISVIKFDSPDDIPMKALNQITQLPNITEVVIDIHPAHLTLNKIRDIKKSLRLDQQLSFKLTVGTISASERRSSLGIDLEDQDLLVALELCRASKCHSYCTVVVGIPFMPVRERFDLAVSTCKWLFQCGCYEIILLPSYLGPDMTQEELYGSGGGLGHVTYWEIVSILAMAALDECNLARISLSHYSDKGSTTKPDQCASCEESGRFAEFFDEYARIGNSGEHDETVIHQRRENLVHGIIRSAYADDAPCICHQQFTLSLSGK